MARSSDAHWIRSRASPSGSRRRTPLLGGLSSLAAAAQRFEGVDQDLSKTLAALQGGLQSFTREIQNFVTSDR